MVGRIVAPGGIAAWHATTLIGCAPSDGAGTEDEIGDPEDNNASGRAGYEHLGTAKLALSSLGYSTYFGGSTRELWRGTVGWRYRTAGDWALHCGPSRMH